MKVYDLVPRPCDAPSDTGPGSCGAPSSLFVMGQWRCRRHDPAGSSACGHSLGVERCSYCGARLVPA